MCATLVVVGLIVAAVLLVPWFAKLVGVAVLILIALVPARADDVLQKLIDAAPPITAQNMAEELRRYPLPVPQTGTGCPPGYSSSPTGVCSPSAGTRCRAFPSPTGSCPTGWSYSPTVRACVECP